MGEAKLKTFTNTGIDVWKYAKGETRITTQRYAQHAVINCRKAGYEGLMFGMPFNNHFFDKMLEIYRKENCMPSNYFFYNWLYENKNTGDIVTVDEYLAIMDKYLGELMDKEIKEIPTYVFRVARQVWKGNMKIQRMRTFRELLTAIFFDKRFSASPQNNFCIKKDGDVFTFAKIEL
jgi:hypothetical protein